MDEDGQKATGLRKLSEWSPGDERLDIFGPCSAESRTQVMDTARALVAQGRPFVFRSGLWKPRTRPGSFEGLGAEALPWLKEVKDELGIPVATEVAKAYHVEACLEAGVDVFWIGARTTVSPFAVQELADALEGVDIPVLVKNPIHPDLSLWMGAIERLEAAGIRSLAAIHRGFHYHDNRPYRNLPSWEIPIELKRQRPDIPIICDISHIAGTPELLRPVAQKASDLLMDGLHVEVHPTPTEARSDAQQQITPEELDAMWNALRFRHSAVDDPQMLEELLRAREHIDAVDTRIIEAIAERMDIVERIGELKKEHGVSIFQLDRWKDIIEHYLSSAQGNSLSAPFLRSIAEAIHSESIETQQKTMNDQAGDESKT